MPLEREGYIFKYWIVTRGDGTWKLNEKYEAGADIYGNYGNATLAGCWEKRKKIEVSWFSDDNLIGKDTFYERDIPEYKGEKPEKKSSKEYDYTFIGWDKEFKQLTEDTTFNAVFEETRRSYEITWLDEDGSQFDVTSVEYGTVPSHEPPEKLSTKEKCYIFEGWEETPVAVTGNATYKASFREIPRPYEITWQYEDGSLIDVTEAGYGTMPSHADPNKKATDEYSYTFIGWDRELSVVDGPAVYTARFTPSKNSYEITWKDENGEVIDVTTVEYGEIPQHEALFKKADPQFEYTFTGWSPSLKAVTGAAEYTAQFSETVNSHEIVWKDENGNIIDTTTVEYGSMPLHPDLNNKETKEFFYEFEGWEPELKEVTGPAEYQAKFLETRKSYEIIWKYENGLVIDAKTWEYGTVPSCEDPEMEATPEFEFIFDGWDPEVTEVDGPAVYTAKFRTTTRSYEIIWKDESGEVIDTTVVKYGETPKHEPLDNKTDSQFEYTFAGWSPSVKPIAGAVEYTATFNKVAHVFDQEVVDEKYLKEEADCTHGTVYYKSCKCGETGTETFEYGDPSEHIFDQENVDEKYLKDAADCTHAAVYYKSCKCGEKGTGTFEYGDPSGHDYQIVEGSAAEPTCTEPGKEADQKCSRCDSVIIGKEIAPIGHVFDQEVVDDKYLKDAADCTHSAVYCKSCKCGEKGTETFGYGDPLGHDYKVVEGSAVEPTCTESGKEADQKCSRCGNVITGKEIATTGHKFDREVVDDKYLKDTADCTHGAVYYKSCKCGEKGTETFGYGNPLGHDYKVVEGSAVEPTCTESGKEADQKCSRCDSVITGKEIAPIGHVFDQEVIDDKYLKGIAGCTNNAVYYKSCKCGEKGTETFEFGDPSGHDYKVVEGSAVAPTCTESGKEADQKCSRCDSVITGKEIAPTGHTFDQEVVADKYLKNVADCTHKAVYYKSCNCGEKGTETFEYGEPLGHMWIAATGVAPKTCEICGITEGEAIRYIPVSGDIVEWKEGDGAIIITIKRSEQDELCFIKYRETQIDKYALAVDAKAGSTVITINEEILKAFAEGEHAITVVFVDGTAEVKLVIKESEKTTPTKPDTEEKQESAKTGDSFPVGQFAALMLLAVCIAVRTIVYRKKTGAN